MRHGIGDALQLIQAAAASRRGIIQEFGAGVLNQDAFERR